MDKAPKSFKRRTLFLVNKEFQLKFIFYILIPNVACLLVFNVLINLYFMSLIKQGQNLNLSADNPYFAMVNNQVSFMNTAFIGLIVLVSCFSIIYGLLLSHKIAGPLYRLKTHLMNSAESLEIKTLNFRPGDFFLDIPVAYNKFKEAYDQKNGKPEEVSSENI